MGRGRNDDIDGPKGRGLQASERRPDEMRTTCLADGPG